MPRGTAAAPLALIFNGVGFGFLRFPDLCVRCTRVIRGGRGRASRPFLRFPVRPPPLRAREVLPLPGRMVPRLGPPHALGRRLRGALARRPRLGRGLRGEARLALPAEARPRGPIWWPLSAKNQTRREREKRRSAPVWFRVRPREMSTARCTKCEQFERNFRSWTRGITYKLPTYK